MKITYLGTSHGVPTETRFTTSFLLQVGDNSYIIDAGAPIASLLLKHNVDLQSIKAMFITHYHMDHILGGFEFMALSNFCYNETDEDVYLPEQSAIDDTKHIINATCYHQFSGEDNVRLKRYDESFCYDDGTIKLTVVPTLHLSVSNRPSYAFIIETEGKRLMFTGDLAAYLEDFPEELYEKHFDYLCIECSHPTVDNLRGKLKGIKCDIIAVTHIYPNEKIPQILKFNDEMTAKVTVPDDNDILIL